MGWYYCRMKYSRLWLSATIIALIIGISFAFSVPHTRDVGETSPREDAVINVPSVSLRDSFKTGVHTITGSLEAPNACATVSARAALINEASSTDGILIELSLPEDSGTCLQAPTQATFMTTIAAPARLPITVTVNGAAATTTVL